MPGGYTILWMLNISGKAAPTLHSPSSLLETSTMNRPQNPYEAASYDLQQFRERRLQDRRMTPRAGEDRRKVVPDGAQSAQPQIPPSDTDQRLN
jgi:hypothetical protein